MKIILYSTLILLCGSCALAQPEINGAKWNVTLKVVGQDGQPVAGAKASIGYMGTPQPGQVVEDSRDLSDEITGLTDTRGLFTASHADTSLTLGFDVQKDGYYPTHISYNLFAPGQFDSQKVAENRNPTLTIVLKKILNPIPMYAKRIRNNPPALNQSIGYDLEVGDWVSPFGKGTTSGIVFKREYYENSPSDYYSKIIVSFPNPGDGIQQASNTFKIKEGSALRSSHEAPADGYQPQLIREINSRTRKFDHDESRIYYFRVTLSDGPHFGKIYGDFMQFRYYLNPVPSSRNVEFDPKRNLFKKLSWREEVNEP